MADQSIRRSWCPRILRFLSVPAELRGYGLPGTHRDKLGVLVSQLNLNTGNPYVVEQFQVNANR